MAATAASPPGHHSCTSTVIWWRLGRKWDPHISILVTQVRTFLTVLRCHIKPRFRAGLQRQWNRLAPLYATGTYTWVHATGIIQGTMRCLIELGFNVLNFLKWEAPSGAVYNPIQLADGSSGPLLQEITARRAQKL